MPIWFEVENFKSIKKLRLELQPFMVLVGANAAGKTNIVQALALLLDILTTGNTTPVELHGGYDQLIRRAKRPAREMRLALSVPIAGSEILETEGEGSLQVNLTLRSDPDRAAQIVQEEVRVSVGGDPLVARWSGDALVELKQSANPAVKRWISERFGDHLRVMLGHRDLRQPLGRLKLFPLIKEFILPQLTRLRLDASSLRIDAQLRGAQQSQALTPEGQGLPIIIERMRYRGRPNSALQRVITRLQEIYPRIEDVSAVRYQPGRVALSFKEHAIGDALGEANISDGVMHALAMLIALEGLKGGAVLVIEEPENALHPWALRRIIEHTQSPTREGSVLLTTHSPVVVDAVKDARSLFVVERDEKRGTIVTPALEKEHALQAILNETGQKLGEIWLGGTLGGVPGAGT